MINMKKVAIVTGANHGIGEAKAFELAMKGHNSLFCI